MNINATPDELFAYLGRTPFKAWVEQQLDLNLNICVHMTDADQLRQAQGKAQLLLGMKAMMDQKSAA